MIKILQSRFRFLIRFFALSSTELFGNSSRAQVEEIGGGSDKRCPIEEIFKYLCGKKLNLFFFSVLETLEGNEGATDNANDRTQIQPKKESNLYYKMKCNKL